MYAPSASKQVNTNQSENKGSDKAESLFSFVDNRPEAAQLQKLQEVSANSQASSPIAQLKGLNAPSGNSAVIQLVSDIKYDTAEFDLEDGTKEVVGKKMVARLESGDQLKGSAPGDGVQGGLMETLKAVGYKRMIRGHLLNGQLGGLGIALNLFPITAKANSQHKVHVENRVKKLIKDGKDVDYTVTVTGAANKVTSPKADFDCEVKDLTKQGGDESFSEIVSSDPGKTTKSSPTEGKVKNSQKGISFPTSGLPKGWGESGKGYNNNDHLNSVKHITTLNQNPLKGLTNDLVGGRSYTKGTIDRKEYAFELMDEFADNFDDQASLNWFKLKIDQLEDYIDTLDASGIEKTIAVFVGTLKSVGIVVEP